MAKTFNDLITGARFYLDEASPADWTDTEVKKYCNYAYHDMISQVMQVYEQFYETTTPFQYALVNNQQEYTIDPTLIKVTRVEINYAPSVSGSTPIRAVAVKMDEALLQLTNTATSGSIFNAGYYLHGSLGSQTIGFIPLPTVSDTGNTKSISVWGIQMPVDLVATSDNVNIPYADNYSNLIELKAASMLLKKGAQDNQSAQAYLNEYLVGIEEMKNTLKDRQADGLQMIEESYPENLDMQTLNIY